MDNTLKQSIKDEIYPFTLLNELKTKHGSLGGKPIGSGVKYGITEGFHIKVLLCRSKPVIGFKYEKDDFLLGVRSCTSGIIYMNGDKEKGFEPTINIAQETVEAVAPYKTVAPEGKFTVNILDTVPEKKAYVQQKISATCGKVAEATEVGVNGNERNQTDKPQANPFAKPSKKNKATKS